MEMPDFGEVDTPAIERRLAVFQAKPLKKPAPKANQWLRSNCMDVFHYVAKQLKDEPLFSDDDDDDDYDDGDNNHASSTGAKQGAIYHDFSEAGKNLISLEEIVNLDKDVDEQSSDEQQQYKPTENFTLHGKDRALRLACEVDRYKLAGDDPRWQWLEGDINAPAYHRSVMLLVCSKLRTVTFDR